MLGITGLDGGGLSLRANEHASQLTLAARPLRTSTESAGPDSCSSMRLSHKSQALEKVQRRAR